MLFPDENNSNILGKRGSDLNPLIVRQNLGEFWEDLELNFKLFFFVDSCSAYIALEKSE